MRGVQSGLGRSTLRRIVMSSVDRLVSVDAEAGPLVDELAEALVVTTDVVVRAGGVSDAEEFLHVADHSHPVPVVSSAQPRGHVGMSGQGSVDDDNEPIGVGQIAQFAEQSSRRRAEGPVVAPRRTCGHNSRGVLGRRPDLYQVPFRRHTVVRHGRLVPIRLRAGDDVPNTHVHVRRHRDVVIPPPAHPVTDAATPVRRENSTAASQAGSGTGSLSST
jgi:hypothetical protein